MNRRAVREIRIHSVDAEMNSARRQFLDNPPRGKRQIQEKREGLEAEIKANAGKKRGAGSGEKGKCRKKKRGWEREKRKMNRRGCPGNQNSQRGCRNEFGMMAGITK